jgi:hypothetical protein
LKLIVELSGRDVNESARNSQTPVMANDRIVMHRSAGVHFDFVQWRIRFAGNHPWSRHFYI